MLEFVRTVRRDGNFFVRVPGLIAAFVVAEVFYKFHSFTLECMAFLATCDGGTSWSDFSNGLPNVVVGDLILHERLRLLRAGTRNRGAWEVGI